MVEIINKILSVGAILVLILDIKLIYFLITKKENILTMYVKNNSMILIFIVSFFASLGSLVYSNIIGYEPCTLCWWQRIGIFGALILSSNALIRTKTCKTSSSDTSLEVFRKGKNIFGSIQALSIFGILFSIYHNYTYYTGFSPLPCGVDVSCTQRLVSEFGFVSIPLMAFITLFTICILAYIGEKKEKTNEIPL